ncbi:CRISPR-associated protein Cas4 [Salegentibacter mishustinae]|jgi:CRISPR-associated exonuclease Cas4|uniref:CRISPR-associated exonuclease Cas4 n=1 Tax=Salegentibacter mishustinae TaxID=270918 RepID=A0A0Q9ZCN5_9FLAO|nr:CRISPR-associated protein Cas4 [Salegentibacter mishustinae]KRG30784.1 CRISPR-associated protein Cas4 [Salegentibacter mishustinae]PNW23671.1 CRISPR-associated protein Cas4 [Salegentibacter mishustinae]PZX66761.1 CRISPR-associated exonuclease Cas4 [Salegentibacter mishustinae]GGW84463.1 CRISPR-associated protein Cas4 [Salegentibacter mishustinae]
MQSFYPSQIIEYLYCPRYTYFEYVLRIPQYEEKFYKVNRGREIHNEKLERNKEYLRKKIGVDNKWIDQYLGIDGLRGKVDEVLELNDGFYAPLDYKFALWKDKVYDTYKQQLYCYAVLIEKTFNTRVEKGFLVYTRSKHKLVEVPIPVEAKQEIKTSMKKMLDIIEQNKFPKATKFKKRCVNCTYRNICIK